MNATRSVAEISRNLDSLERQVQAEREALQTAVILERSQAHAREVYRRFLDGDYVVCGCAQLWWCRDGQLLTTLEPDEVSGLHALEQDRVISRETGRRL